MLPKHKHRFKPDGNFMTVNIPPERCLLHQGTNQVCGHKRKDVIRNIKLDPEEYCGVEGCNIQLKHINQFSVLPDYVRDGEGYFITEAI